jgi:hypothetical protein
MSMLKDQTVAELIREQLNRGLERTRHARACESFPDADFLFAGVERVLGTYDSGRDWLQRRRDQGRGPVARATAFDAINSSRREAMTRDVAAALQREFVGQLAEEGVDHLAAFPELKAWTVLACDGHAVEHACHADRDARGRYVPDSGLYTLDLRTGLSAFLRPVGGDGRHAHEWPAFRAAVRELRPDTRVLFVEDRAFIDLPRWDRYRRRGLHQITRLKENMYPVEETPLPFDRTDPVNVGVRRYTRARFRGVKGTFLLITYRDPETGEAYTFLASLPEGFRPGVLAWLYFLRWGIEKLYDTFKNKLHETKAWANSPSAAAVRPLFISLAYNLLLWLQHRLHRDFGIRDEKVARKFRAHIAQRAEAAAKANRQLHPLCTLTLSHRMAQMSAQFIRCVSNLLHNPMPLRRLLAQFQDAQLAYL